MAISATTLNEKTRLLKWLENALLVLVLSVTVLRATYIESPHIDRYEGFFLSAEIISLLFSSFLLACVFIWLMASILLNQWRWRKTWLVGAIAAFFVAGIISFSAASNKRAAVTDWVVLATPMITAMFLAQWLTSRAKIRFALLLVIAIGIAAAVQCGEQLTDSNEIMIQQYEQDPMKQLQQQGIEPDSLEHWMYEHRLYSRDIRGFLMTSNSAASFFLLSVFAALGLCVQAFRERKNPETLAALICYGLAFVLVLAGLVMTQSKGGLGALMVGVFLFAVLSLFGKHLWKYRVVVGIVCLMVIVAVAGMVINYGHQHGRLPGGNSMLVRWQYWQSTADMMGDHLWAGVGGGNFSEFYPHYKNAAASETIQNPHCWILSLASQYGPLGLGAFVFASLAVCFKSLQVRLTANEAALPQDTSVGSKKVWLALLMVTTCLLLAVRPLLMGTVETAQMAEGVAAYAVLYLFPAFVFVTVFGVLAVAGGGDSSVQKPGLFLAMSIICGLTAVLIHNLVDFAMFEPGIWGTFWLLVAILIADIHTTSSRQDTAAVLGSGTRLLSVLGLFIGGVLFVTVAVAPPVKAAAVLKSLSRTGSYEEFKTVIQNAADADGLSPDGPYTAAAMLKQIQSAAPASPRERAMIEQALEYARMAQQRNPAGFKAYRMESDLYLLLADQNKDAAQADALQRAYAALLKAAERYPGSDKIQYGLGMIAEELGYWEKAWAHFHAAVDIEKAYQAQFKIMYPGREPVVSRLGNTAYTIAQAKLEELQRKIDAHRSNGD